MNLFAEAARLTESNTPFALATIVSTKGSAPRHSSQMLVRRDGTVLGTVGGGLIENHVIDQAMEAIVARKPRTIQRSLTRKGKDAMDMDCAGAMTIHIDVHGLKPEMVLAGAGHVNRAVAALAGQMGFEITVVDSYEPNLNALHFPNGTRLVHGETMAEGLTKVELNDNCYVLVATNHEDTDGLAAVIESSSSYIALLGSRTKVKTLKQRMLERGVSPEVVAGIRAPVGLDIGAETPVEIAVSIMAEILMERNERSGRPMKDSIRNGGSNLVVIRGAGDMATGTAIRLKRSGFQVAMLDVAEPTVIRTSVAFAQTMFVDGSVEVEGIKAHKACSVAEAWRLLDAGTVPVLIDPKGEILRQFKPGIVIDSILAKKNLGTSKEMAPLTIALGPGFNAGEDVDVVVETNRGHNLGRVILEGPAAQNTGIPGNIAGYTEERIIRAPSAGEMQPLAAVGDLVVEGQMIAKVGNEAVTAKISGKIRGMLNPGISVTEGFKIGDIDPRGEQADHTTVSDKARAVAGGVLEAIMMFRH
ncbi:selenium-dependent molybdenum cofactor biosynthesis protein YqeB [Sansalvadorimonas sp. 2012CJ34-2]|uniref:Selenium-dependent molybdenum cofactor biosynthesis protein YqeB n=1 Tax=Parendozoicomonas callyspongiae TaxID=2942213 RepID=A0ABT0PGK1_9GAMM|nr:selenium-dependent molybdenum cofactor biosynthesis protein YqeB [Sansalvadorimonas sp. 2012CJ34-2]MCL6270479.1 selenium-dependent molybdenum cofactor biosynthesis protein YqeB [Sansalvadorimonas sp. 2012CJ34-2]